MQWKQLPNRYGSEIHGSDIHSTSLPETPSAVSHPTLAQQWVALPKINHPLPLIAPNLVHNTPSKSSKVF